MATTNEPPRRASLTVWRYDAPMGADAGALRLRNLEEQGAITVHDAITVSWLRQEDRPRIGHVRHRTSSGMGIGAGTLTRVRKELEPGSSALVVLSTDADLDKVRALFDRGDTVLVDAELTEEGQHRLDEAIATGFQPPEHTG